MVEGGRTQQGPRLFEDFEKLYNELKKRTEENKIAKVDRQSLVSHDR